jgi:hypothetical protein
MNATGGAGGKQRCRLLVGFDELDAVLVKRAFSVACVAVNRQAVPAKALSSIARFSA